MFRLVDTAKDEIVGVRVEGKITQKDYDELNPILNEKIEKHGKIDLMLLVDEIDSVTPKAVLDDFMTYFSHIRDFEKIAVVGDKRWHEMMTKISNPFISGKVKYFDNEDVDDAGRWLNLN